MTEDNYEFSAQENQTIRDLAKKMGKVGVLLIVIGILLTVWFVFAALSTNIEHGVVALPLAIYFVVSGVLTLRSQIDFRMIVATQGNDIFYTMRALTELRRFYTLTLWLVIACIILVILAIPATTEKF